MIDRIKWQGHSSFIIDGEPKIQIAPWRVVTGERAPRLILIGHDHFDHCSPADVEKIRDSKTVLVGNEAVARVIEGTIVLRDWQSISVDRANVKAIPAYSPQDARHPRSQNGLGFVISIDYYDIYYVGDSQIVPEMEYVRPDILMLPIDGYGRLTVSEALQLVAILKPRWAIPYNWGGAGEEATVLDAQSFKAQASIETEVLLLPVTQ